MTWTSDRLSVTEIKDRAQPTVLKASGGFTSNIYPKSLMKIPVWTLKLAFFFGLTDSQHLPSGHFLHEYIS